MLKTWRFILKDDPHRRIYWSVFALGVLLALWTWSRSTGSSSDDEFGHLLISQSAWRRPDLALDLWGRVLNTLLYMIPSLFGLAGVRVAAFLMTGLTVLITTHIARQLGITRLYLIPLMLWFQPGVIDQSYAAVTGVPFMLLLALAVALWLDDHFVWSSITFACLSMTRHEGIALFGVWFLYMLYRHQWRAAIIGWAPIALYNLIYLIVIAPPLNQLPILTYFFTNRGTEYGSGSWFHFVGGLVIMSGLPILFWGVYSVPRLRQLGRRFLIFVPYALYFVLHTIIFRFGLYASGGYYEFLLPVCPAMALLGAMGTDTIIEGLLKAARRNNDRTRTFIRQLWAVIVFVPVIAFSLSVAPRAIRPPQQAAVDAAAWLKKTDIPPERVSSMYVWFYYFYGLPLKEFDGWIHPPQIQNVKQGDVFVWDTYAESSTNYTRAMLSDPANGWKLLQSFSDEVMIFQKTDRATQ